MVERRIEVAKRLLALRPLQEVLAEVHAERAVEVLRVLVRRPCARLQGLGDGGVVLLPQLLVQSPP